MGMAGAVHDIFSGTSAGAINAMAWPAGPTISTMPCAAHQRAPGPYPCPGLSADSLRQYTARRALAHPVVAGLGAGAGAAMHPHSLLNNAPLAQLHGEAGAIAARCRT